MRRGHPQQGVPSVATQQQRLPPLLVELAARARAQLVELAARARARCWRRARGRCWWCFRKLKHIQLIWEGPLSLPHRSVCTQQQ